ncbi:ent-kaurene oxidase [Pyrenophora seminiperda CCB06]|uniref:Ent-kaurene oxidase n=1 Tax=Pyrenophora seminiperda CCB06 TaxID=1302712 RepID=A0A3M7ME95_9PLEO|nr:ent-kaurene oxidase [Pyrenophora seminiperda CCB06]
MRSVEPFLHDFVGSYTGGKIICDSDVQNRVLMQRVTPHLEAFVPEIKDELDFALQKELPQLNEEDWVEVDIAKTLPRIIARITARVLLGPTECRNEKWLQTTAEYTENVFITGFVLRFVPRIFRPFVAAVLPTYWKLFKNMSIARSVIGASASRRTMKRKEDVLQWIMDFAKPEELETDNLTERMLVLSLAGIHTTALTTAQALYDLCARPEDFSTIHTELAEVTRTEENWSKGMLLRMINLDSLLKESQRLSPVFLLTFNRILPNAVTLSNGVHLPKGTRVAVPQNAILNHPAQVPGADPLIYDPWRYAKLRENPENAQKYQFAMVDGNSMAFGYGRYACPGRFFVAAEIKMILAHLLANFDWKLPEGAGRPRNFTIDSDMYPDMSARVLMKRRKMDAALQPLLGF